MARGVLNASYAADRRLRPEVAFRYRLRARAVVEALREHLPGLERPRVLDLGSAEGRTLVEMSALLDGASFLGVEASAELLAAGPEMPEGIRLVEGDVTALGEAAEPESFDLVSALALLEHLPAPLDAVREAARVLRPGGLFIATCPHPFWDRLSTGLGLLAGGQHESELDRAGMTTLVVEGGLELAAYRPFMWAPVAFLPYLRIPVSASLASKLDRWIGAVRVLDFLFVNQLVIARKGGATASGG